MDNVLKLNHVTTKIANGENNESSALLKDINFSLKRGEILAIAGPSGSGKSMLCKSIMGLLPGNIVIVEGSIEFQGMDLVTVSEREYRKIRGNEISMVFQDSLTSLNPSIRIGKQIGEVIRLHDKGAKSRDIYSKVVKLLEIVGIEDATIRYKAYPLELSGGMRQRCAIAMALAMNPKVLLADEPTTALDVTVQAKILDLLKDIRDKLGTSIILVTHDLGVVASVADRVAIMNKGQILEVGDVNNVFKNSANPFTKAFLESHPVFLNRRGSYLE